MLISEMTARKHGVAKSVKELLPRVISHKKTTAVDYGAGWLRNSKYLISHGVTTYITETPRQLERIKHLPEINYMAGVYSILDIPNYLEVDFALLTYVLNIIEKPSERVRTLQRLYKLLKPWGYLIVEVRSKKDICSAKYISNYNDGYLMGKYSNTFQKPYTLRELNELIIPEGFKLIDAKKGSNSIYAFYQKEENICMVKC